MGWSSIRQRFAAQAWGAAGPTWEFIVEIWMKPHSGMVQHLLNTIFPSFLSGLKLRVLSVRSTFSLTTPNGPTPIAPPSPGPQVLYLATDEVQTAEAFRKANSEGLETDWWILDEWWISEIMNRY